LSGLLIWWLRLGGGDIRIPFLLMRKGLGPSRCENANLRTFSRKLRFHIDPSGPQGSRVLLV
jgi:hypothetical protein